MNLKCSNQSSCSWSSEKGAWAEVTRTVFLEDDTLDMGCKVRMNVAFPRQGAGLGQTRERVLNSGR